MNESEQQTANTRHLSDVEQAFCEAAGELFECYCTERPDWSERGIHDDECNRINVKEGTAYVIEKLRHRYLIVPNAFRGA